MIAGTLLQLATPCDDPLDSWYRNGDIPALDVERSQSALEGDHVVQSGVAGGTTEATEQRVTVGTDHTGGPLAIDVETDRVTTRVATDWVAEVQESGLIVPESVAGDGEVDFPIDLFYHAANAKPERLTVDVESLRSSWGARGELGDVWMSSRDANGTEIDYHGAAREADPATIGLGFERPWSGTVAEGVVFESGYLAVYSMSDAPEFIRFVTDEILPYCHPRDEDDGDEQATLDESTGGDDDA